MRIEKNKLSGLLLFVAALAVLSLPVYAAGDNVNMTSTNASMSKTVTVDIMAKDMAFNTSTITVPAGAEVTMNFDNQDSGVPHNVAIYSDESKSEEIYKGEVITGPKKTVYMFTAPSEPGTYYFQCDIHPNMNGEFIVE